jgi:hypothetical protein
MQEAAGLGVNVSEKDRHYYREILKALTGIIRLMQEVKQKIEPLAK